MAFVSVLTLNPCIDRCIYLPGKLGVRIEDVIYLTEDGCRNLTRAKKELLIL